MPEPTPLDIANARPRRLEFVVAAIAVALGLFATTLRENVFLAKLVLEDRAKECRAHQDGDPAYVRRMLEQERLRLCDNLSKGLIAFGIGCLAVALDRRRRALPPFTGILVGALAVSSVELGHQVELVVRGARSGLFTESETDHRIRFFDAAVEPAQIIIDHVPADARIVVVNFDDPQVLKKVQYLIFPRRVFMPPRAEMQFDVRQIRKILERMPHGIDWCFAAGYTHLLDLTTLRQTRDPSAIVELESLRR